MGGVLVRDPTGSIMNSSENVLGCVFASGYRAQIAMNPINTNIAMRFSPFHSSCPVCGAASFRERKKWK